MSGTTISTSSEIAREFTASATDSPITVLSTGTIDVEVGYAIATRETGGGQWLLDNAGLLRTGGGNAIDLGLGGAAYAVANSTVINEATGTISGTGAGVIINGTGTVSNLAGGVIAGGIGIALYSTVGIVGETITNAGTISGSETNGITLGTTDTAVSGAVVTNQSGGFIAGNFSGIVIDGSGSVTNIATGTITATGKGATAIVVDASGTVDNFGVISGAGLGIYLAATGEITNEAGGNIAAAGGGVIIDGAGSVTNIATGTITGGGPSAINIVRAGTVSNAGRIIGTAGSGVYLGTIHSTIVPAGGIVGLGGAVTNGSDSYTVGGVIPAASAPPGVVTNQSGGYILGSTNGIAINGAGSVINIATGTIKATGAAASFSAIAMLAAGTVDNAGVISGASRGIYLKTSGLVTNEATGNITAAGAGVSIKGAGSVTNAPGGTITGGSGAGAINILAAGTVSNSGVLSDSAGNGSGIYFGTKGAPVTGALVANLGIGDISAGGIGVLINGTGSVTNAASGTIIGSGYSGVLISRDGAVDNSGTIHGGAFGIYIGAVEHAVSAQVYNRSFGSISGASYGVAVTGSGSVTNSTNGTINASTGDAVGITVGGTVINSGLLSGGTEKGHGIYIGYYGAPTTNAVVTNLSGGTIAGATGIYIYGSGSVTNMANATISGSRSGVFFYDPGSTLTNAGTISSQGASAVDFAGGPNNLLVVDPGAAFDGHVGGGGGVLELAIGDGSAGRLDGVGASIVNFDTIEFDTGANWTLGATLIKPLAGAITQFAIGDTIDVANFLATSKTFVSNALTLTAGDLSTTTLHIVGGFDAGDFAIKPDGGGGTDVTLAIAWGDGNGDWSLAGNWTPIGVPGTNDTAVIDKAGSNTVTIALGESEPIANLTLAGATDALNVLGTLIPSGTLEVDSGSVSLGSTGVISGGTIADIPGGGIAFNGGTVDGATFQGPLQFGDGGTLNVMDSLVATGVGGAGAGTIDLNGGGHVVLDFAGDQTFDNATIDLDSGGGGGALTEIDSGGTTGSELTLGSLLVVSSTVGGTHAAIRTAVGATNTMVLNRGTIIAGSSGGNFLIDPAGGFINQGSILVANGDTLDVDSAIVAGSGTGTIAIASGGDAHFAAAVEADQTLAFTDGTGTLTIDQPSSFTATITGFNAGNTIDLADLVADSATWTAGVGGAPGTLIIKNGGSTVATLSVTGDYTGATFTAAPDGGGSGSAITVVGVAPCFADGTRILTPRGTIAVERLRQGDTVLTVSGSRQRIQWIGYRHVDCRRHIDRARALPIRIAKHAFGENRPNHPLLLSPDHSVFVEGVLIPIKFLVNDTSIIQVEVEAVSYFHIELERHDVLLADGLPAETYLETGGRNAFANTGGTMQLHPNFEPDQARVGMVWQSFGYAPLLGANGELERTRQKLAWQAALLGGKAKRPGRVRRAEAKAA